MIRRINEEPQVMLSVKQTKKKKKSDANPLISP